MNEDAVEGMLSFGKQEIEDSPPLHSGEMILCPHCGWGHIVEGATNVATGEQSTTLLFYTCGETSYLAGVDGKNVMRRFM